MFGFTRSVFGFTRSVFGFTRCASSMTVNRWLREDRSSHISFHILYTDLTVYVLYRHYFVLIILLGLPIRSPVRLVDSYTSQTPRRPTNARERNNHRCRPFLTPELLLCTSPVNPPSNKSPAAIYVSTNSIPPIYPGYHNFPPTHPIPSFVRNSHSV